MPHTSHTLLKPIVTNFPRLRSPSSMSTKGTHPGWWDSVARSWWVSVTRSWRSYLLLSCGGSRGIRWRACRSPCKCPAHPNWWRYPGNWWMSSHHQLPVDPARLSCHTPFSSLLKSAHFGEYQNHVPACWNLMSVCSSSHWTNRLIVSGRTNIFSSPSMSDIVSLQGSTIQWWSSVKLNCDKKVLFPKSKETAHTSAPDSVSTWCTIDKKSSLDIVVEWYSYFLRNSTSSIEMAWGDETDNVDCESFSRMILRQPCCTPARTENW